MLRFHFRTSYSCDVQQRHAFQPAGCAEVSVLCELLPQPQFSHLSLKLKKDLAENSSLVQMKSGFTVRGMPNNEGEVRKL